MGLAVEGGYGINVLRYTESVQATSSTSNLSDVIRGLGYWYFYGGDRMGTWTQAAVDYTQKLWLIALSYALPVVAFAAAVLARWRYRAFFVALVVVGVALSVGAYPYEHPTAFGALAKAFMTKTTAGPGPAVDGPGHPPHRPGAGHADRDGGGGRLRPALGPPGVGARRSRRRRPPRWPPPPSSAGRAVVTPVLPAGVATPGRQARPPPT